MSAPHVVLGAGGVTGRRVVATLHAQGHAVRAVTRDGRDVGVPGVERAAADGCDVAATVRACRGAASVVFAVMPPLRRWHAEFPLLAEHALAAAEQAGARLVHADDTWMDGDRDTPLTAHSPVRPEHGLAALRAFLAERMLHAGTAGRLPVSVVRAGELYGPGVRSLIADNVFRAAARGRTVFWFGDPDQPLTPTFADDFAAALAAVAVHDTAGAAVRHVPHPAPTTGRALAGLACAHAGTRLRLRSVGTRGVRALGVVVPTARAGAPLIAQFEQPFVVDGSATARAFHLHPTPYRVGVAAAVDAHRS